MHYAIISDVHANLEALEAVLEDIRKRDLCKNILFLGDAVGYGANPNECIKLLKENSLILLAGNHDWAVLGLTDIEDFNPYAKTAIHWTMEVISEENKKTLSTFPISKSLKKDSIFLVHSTPKEPHKWHYLFSISDAEVNFKYFSERICLIAHSHQPFILERQADGRMQTHRERVKLRKDSRYIINVGSVGQPRDGDMRACYAILNDVSVELIRVEYDLEKTQKKMYDEGLPAFLIERLSKGM